MKGGGNFLKFFLLKFLSILGNSKHFSIYSYFPRKQNEQFMKFGHWFFLSVHSKFYMFCSANKNTSSTKFSQNALTSSIQSYAHTLIGPVIVLYSGSIYLYLNLLNNTIHVYSCAVYACSCSGGCLG